MVWFCKVLKLEAQSVKKQLIEHKLYDYDIKPQSDTQCVFLPLQKDCDLTKSELTKSEQKQSELAKSELQNQLSRILKVKFSLERKVAEYYTFRTKSLKQILIELGLNNNQIKTISSYDSVGNIAILKITEDMLPYEKQIANALLDTNKHLSTIVKKTENHHGVYRTQSVKWLAGKRTFTTYAKELGAIFKVKVGDMFFSPRLCYERERIARMILPNSNVAVFFSGVAPFSIIVAKIQPDVNKVYSIELNPKAHENAIENIKLNKVENKVEAVCDDVNNFSHKVKDWADYVVMPLPKTSDDFLDAAFNVVRKPKKSGDKSGIISLYKFVPVKKPYDEIINELDDFAKSKGLKLEVLFKRQVRDYSTDIEQIVIDFRFIK